MILILSKGLVKIKPMKIPERKQLVDIKYIFEAGTNHLIPILYIHKNVYEGERVKIDMTDFKTQDQVHFKVELVSHTRQVVRTYEGTIQQHDYVLFGIKPVRPDVDEYIKELELRIEVLEEQGEVI